MGEVIIEVTADTISVIEDGRNGPGIPLGVLAKIASEKEKAIIDGVADVSEKPFGQNVTNKIILTGDLDEACLREIINLSGRRNVPIHVTMVANSTSAK